LDIRIWKYWRSFQKKQRSWRSPHFHSLTEYLDCISCSAIQSGCSLWSRFFFPTVSKLVNMILKFFKTMGWSKKSPLPALLQFRMTTISNVSRG
jgi:hypothetical protein